MSKFIYVENSHEVVVFVNTYHIVRVIPFDKRLRFEMADGTKFDSGDMSSDETQILLDKLLG